MAVELAQAEEIRGHLLRTPGWERVADEVMTEFISHAQLLSIRRKQELFLRGHASTGLYLVRSGELKVGLVSREGREQILYLAAPGRFIGESCMPEDMPTPASSFAMVDSEVWLFPPDAVEELLGRSPALGAALRREMGFRLSRLIDLVWDLSLRSVQRRLAGFLFGLASQAEVRSDGARHPPPFRHEHCGRAPRNRARRGV